MRARLLLTAFGLFMVAVVVHTWTATLPFQLDDYALLPGASDRWALQDQSAQSVAVDGGAPEAPLNTAERYLYRPVSWGLWWTLIQINGDFADPRLFHATFLFLHGLVVVVVYFILRGLGAVRGAILGALAVAIMPGGIQAVSWTAATGDLIATLLMAIATLSIMGRGGIRLALSALCVGAAFLAKESAFLLLPAMGFAAFAVRPDLSTSRRLAPMIPALLALALAWALRANALGGRWSLSYAYEVVPTIDVAYVVSKVRSFVGAIMQGVVPWNQDPALSDAGVFPRLSSDALSAVILSVRSGMLVFVGAVTLSGFIAGRRFGIRVWLVGALCVSAALIPATLLFSDDGTNVGSRLLYPPLVVAAILFGLAWERVNGGWIVGYLLIQMLFASHVASTEAVAAEKIRSRLTSLRELVHAHPTETWVLQDNQAGVGGIPLLYGNVTGAFHPPIARETHKLIWWGDALTMDRIPNLWDQPSGVRFASVRGDRYVEDRSPVPALTKKMPQAVAHATGDVVTFDQAVPTRSLAAVRVTPAMGQGMARSVDVTWRLESGERSVSLGFVDARGESVLLYTPDDFDWTLGRQVTGFEIKGLRVSGNVELLSTVARAQIVAPKAGSIINPESPPALVFRPVTQMEGYRITYDFVLMPGVRFPVVYEVPVTRMEPTGDGLLRFLPREGDAVRWPGHPYHVTWQTLPSAFARELVARGIRRMSVAVRVEGVTAEFGAPAWRSDWRTFVVEAPSR